MDDINLLRTLVTVIAFLVYVGVVAWAYAPKSRSRFDEASRLPFDTDDRPHAASRSDA